MLGAVTKGIYQMQKNGSGCIRTLSSIFSKDRNLGIKVYKEFVLKENSEDIIRILGRIRVPPVFGDDKFMRSKTEDHGFTRG